MLFMWPSEDEAVSHLAGQSTASGVDRSSASGVDRSSPQSTGAALSEMSVGIDWL